MDPAAAAAARPELHDVEFPAHRTKVSWDTQCTGQMDMTGHGEITFTSDDAYTGMITFSAEGVTMTVNLTGTKLASATTQSADRRQLEGEVRMNALFIRAPLTAAAFASLLGSATTLAQAPAASPFAKLPALPTTCYAEGDTFSDKVAAATEATQADIDRQKAVNQQIEEEFNNIDPMVKAQKMQQWMMSNPQEAMKWAQAQQQIGAEAQTVGPELNAAAMQFESEKKALVAGYESALKQSTAPADARVEAMNAKLGPSGCGVGDTECSPEPWVVEEFNAIQKLRTPATRACARRTGPRRARWAVT